MQPLDLYTLKTQYGAQIKALAAKHRLENVRIFGSVARGEARPDSDIDILVHGLPGCRLIKFENAISAMLAPTAVDVVDDEEIHRLLAPYILKDATAL